MPWITANDVSLRYGDRPVLRGISARFDCGPVAIMGPSGSGKSSLLGVLAGALTPDSGSVQRADVTVSWVMQSAPILGKRSVIDNVALGPLSVGASHDLARARAEDALLSVGLDGLGSQSAHRLSGGERQRVAVARAIATGAGIVLADEPTASLDPRTRSQVCDALLAASGRDLLVIIATHDPYVRDRCARAYTLDDGTLSSSK